MSTNEELKDFRKTGDIPAEVIAKYENKLPAELVSLWKNYGTGSFLNGYLKLVNPDEYIELLADSYETIDSTPIAIFTTSMADIIAYESGYIILINYRRNTSKTVGKSLTYLLEDINEETFLNKNLDWQPYPQAVGKLGVPAYDECFGYEPVLAAGGSEKVENLRIVKLIEHIGIITQFAGPI
jgi:hypothetical protein